MMTWFRFLVVTTLTLSLACSPNKETPSEIPYLIEIAVEGLNVPWEMDVAKDGRIFLTERTGTIRVIIDNQLRPEPVIDLTDQIHSRSESGLLGLVLDPDFLNNGYMYVYHTYEQDARLYNRVLRLKESNHHMVIDKILLDGLGGELSTNHSGGRMKIGPDGYLYISVGEQYKPELAQDVQNYAGKILRIALDGSIPDDNPFPDSPVYSLGHRNVQGLAWHPVTKQLYASEHGQSAKDEINIIDKGANYGWPLIEGDETSTQSPGLRRPLIHSGETTWAPSGMTFVTHGPWKGELLVANLRGNQVLRVTLATDGQAVKKVDTLFRQWGRIRNVYEAPNGTLYIMTNNRDGRGKPVQGDDKLIRLVPKNK